MSTPMQKNDTGWVANIHLKPGKYLYKFIVDGKWMHDQNNDLVEPDGHGEFNSVYFNYNYTFRLNGYLNAKRVIVSGSFNNWSEKELKMKKGPGGWELDLYLSEGTHAYKFIVDGEWILDPENKVLRPDGMGNLNSFISLGDTTYFKLNGYQNARLVILTGSFNGWNTAELEMQRTDTGWQIPYVLAPGNYEYKYIVEGTWIYDPDNPLQIGDSNHINSLKVIEPNHTFWLEKYLDAKQVLLSGSFNNWADPGYMMIKTDAGWAFPFYLSAGKYTYKFVIDSNWIIDPHNPLVEDNEFGTGNSVLWIEPEKEYLEK
jgi:1,4-alpha-glucan branching enzyme